MNTKAIFITLITLLFVFTGLYFGFFKIKSEPRNVLLIGWDGADRRVVYDLLKNGGLPNLKKIVDEGSVVDIRATSEVTVTKPGWAEILSGQKSSSTLGILDNVYYKPIPRGYTIFEQLEYYYGVDKITTALVTGKYVNLGARGPHKICVNCVTRDPVTSEKIKWWDDVQGTPLKEGETKRYFEDREGEPFYYTKEKLDFYASGLGAAPNVGKVALGLIEKYKNDRFFMFFHFEEPDEPGHVFGGSASKEYKQGLLDVDFWLGEIVAELRKYNLYDKTLIYVTSDHGFPFYGLGSLSKRAKNSVNSNGQHRIFLATNNSEKLKKPGRGLDVVPTILGGLGVDPKKVLPTLVGKNLYELN